METFVITGAEKFIIYGAAYLGCDVYCKLKRKGYYVKCFLDKRANILENKMGVDILHPEHYSGDKNCVVVIATGNPISVAYYLQSIGFKKLLYSNPFADKNLSLDAWCMQKGYEEFMMGRIPLNIPVFNSKTMDVRFCDDALIEEKCNETIAYAPIDLMFCGSTGDEIHFYTKYLDLICYLSAFSEDNNLQEKIKEISSQIDIEKIGGIDIVLSSEERMVYTQTKLNTMHILLNRGMEWYIQNPIRVKVRENKIIVDDKDAFLICFFVSKGLQKIPVSMSNEDYMHWKNSSVLSEVVQFAVSHDLLTSYTMLEHPNFYLFPAARDIGRNNRMLEICKYLKDNKVDISGKNIVDIGSYFGGISRFFCRMGGRVTSVETTKNAYEFSVLFNKLMYCDSIVSILGDAQNVINKKYDITVMLTVLYWHIHSEAGVELMHAVDYMTNGMMIWESGDSIEEEKNFILKNSSFTKYQKISETVGTGRVRELGVWSR